MQGTLDLVDGTDGPDTLDGTAGDDDIAGFGGDDVIYGYEGDDILAGGLGYDFALDGGEGNDTITGGAGFDVAQFDFYYATARVIFRRTSATPLPPGSRPCTPRLRGCSACTRWWNWTKPANAASSASRCRWG